MSMAEQENNQAMWYVVHTYSGYENKVATNLMTIVENRRLQDLIHEVRVPVEKAVEVKNGQEREVEHKLFPGYVLVKMVMTDESWYIVRNCRGVTGFVGSSVSKPVPLSQSEVDALGMDTDAQITVDYEVGDQVEILAGALKGMIGMVSTIDIDKNLVKVTVSMFGRETPAEVELNQVKKI